MHDRLERVQAGIEAGMSSLKQRFGLKHSRWNGLAGLGDYAQSAIFFHKRMHSDQLRLT